MRREELRSRRHVVTAPGDGSPPPSIDAAMLTAKQRNAIEGSLDRPVELVDHPLHTPGATGRAGAALLRRARPASCVRLAPNTALTSFPSARRTSGPCVNDVGPVRGLLGGPLPAWAPPRTPRSNHLGGGRVPRIGGPDGVFPARQAKAVFFFLAPSDTTVGTDDAVDSTGSRNGLRVRPAGVGRVST